MPVHDERGRYSPDEIEQCKTVLGMQVVAPVQESVFERINAIRKEITHTDTMQSEGLRAVQRLQEEMKLLMQHIPDVTL